MPSFTGDRWELMLETSLAGTLKRKKSNIQNCQAEFRYVVLIILDSAVTIGDNKQLSVPKQEMQESLRLTLTLHQ